MAAATTLQLAMNALFQLCVPAMSDGALPQTLPPELVTEATADERASIYAEDDTEVFYEMGARYAAGAARGVVWDDPALAIEWPIEPVVIGERDRRWPRWER